MNSIILYKELGVDDKIKSIDDNYNAIYLKLWHGINRLNRLTSIDKNKKINIIYQDILFFISENEMQNSVKLEAFEKGVGFFVIFGEIKVLSIK